MVNLVCPEVPIQELPCSIKAPRILGLIFTRDYLQKEVCRLTEADFMACRAIHWQGYATLTNAPAAVKSFLCIPEQQYNNVYDLKLERGFEAHTQYAKILMFAHLYRVAIIWEDGHYSGFYDFSTQGGSMTYGNIGTTVSELTIKISTSSLALGFSDGSVENQPDVRVLFNYSCETSQLPLPSCDTCPTEALPVIQALQQAGAIDGYIMTSDYRNLICETVSALVNCGAWQLIDVMYFTMARTRGMGLINWKNPGTFDLVPVNSNPNDFVVNQGFRSTGVFYLNSNWNPVLNGVNYTVNGSSWGLMHRGMVKRPSNYFHSAAYNAGFGSYSAQAVQTQNNFWGFFHDELTGGATFDLRATSIQPATANWLASTRNGIGAAGIIQPMIDATFATPVVSGLAQQIHNANVVVLGVKLTDPPFGTVASFDNLPIQFVFRGGYLSTTQLSCLYTAVENFYTQLQLV